MSNPENTEVCSKLELNLALTDPKSVVGVTEELQK